MRHPGAYWPQILAVPDNDTPRLAYADYLARRSDPLSEFIRLQCAQARRQEACLAFSQREADLIREYGAEWADEVSDKVEWWSFRRGFIGEVSVTASSFCEHAQRLFACAPLTDVHVTPDGALEFMPEVDGLGRAIFVDLSSHPLHDDGVAQLARAPLLAQAYGLNLSDCALGDAGVAALCEANDLGALRELYLCNNFLTDAGARMLVMSHFLDQLDVLWARDNQLTDEGQQTLQMVLGSRVHF